MPVSSYVFLLALGVAVFFGVAQGDPEPCICTLEYDPHCNPKTGASYANTCIAVRCAGENEDDLVEGECGDESGPCQEEPFVVGPCRAAINRWSYVEETNTCEMFSYGGCRGTANNFESEVECQKTCGTVTEPCICTKEYAPLCNPETGVTYGNKCEAVTCAGENEADLVEGECEEEDDCCPEDQACCGSRCIPSNELAFNICPAEGTCCDDDGGGEDPGCFCPLFVDPVCSESTGESFSNACFAGCSDDPGPFSAEACE